MFWQPCWATILHLVNRDPVGLRKFVHLCCTYRLAAPITDRVHCCQPPPFPLLAPCPDFIHLRVGNAISTTVSVIYPVLLKGSFSEDPVLAARQKSLSSEVFVPAAVTSKSMWTFSKQNFSIRVIFKNVGVPTQQNWEVRAMLIACFAN